MIHQKDWLMRQIEAMIAAIVRFLFHTRKESQDKLLLQNEQIKKAIQAYVQTERRLPYAHPDLRKRPGYPCGND